MTKQKLLSIGIPTYEMYGLGATFLKASFDILKKQHFKDFDVVISDYSKDDSIKKLCDEYRKELDIHYHKNTDPAGGMSANGNNVIKHATGKLIKILFQDDLLYNEQSLGIVAKNFDLEKDSWLVTGCIHTKDGHTFYNPHHPRYNHKIYLGNNTIGSPSVLTIKNSGSLFFDTKLKWMMDCDYYKRCYDAFGKPKLVHEIAAVIRVGAHQITNTEVNEALKKAEQDYLALKYKRGIVYWLKKLLVKEDGQTL